MKIRWPADKKSFLRNTSCQEIVRRRFTPVTQALTNNFNISVEGKYKEIIDKLLGDIVEDITRFGDRDKSGREDVNQMQNELFVFNVIDDNNKKITNTLSVEDPEFVLKLEESTEK
ncbi:MAG: hypothetical protein JRI88_05100 [Deltaproteobacteria bacterium]|nr:hypothetical protein [Deltaproteobacteria bacterium]